MSFFNKKEDVIDIQLTQHGKHLLSKGKFKPAYYSFFDDDILYDAQYSGITGANKEEQNDIQPRIEQTPYLKTQYVFSDRDRDVRKLRYVTENIQVDANTQSTVDRHRALALPLGTSSLGVDKAPAWNVTYLKGGLKSSTSYTNDSKQTINIPQVNSEDILYTTEVKVDYLGLTNEQINNNLEGSLVMYAAKHTDNSYVVVDEDYLLLDVAEINSDFDNENFDIEVFRVKDVDIRGQQVEGESSLRIEKPAYIQITSPGGGSHEDLEWESDFSVNFWIKLDALSHAEVQIFGDSIDGSANLSIGSFGIWYEYINSIATIIIKISQTYEYYYQDHELQPLTWYNIKVVRDSTDNIRLFRGTTELKVSSCSPSIEGNDCNSNSSAGVLVADGVLNSGITFRPNAIDTAAPVEMLQDSFTSGITPHSGTATDPSSDKVWTTLDKFSDPATPSAWTTNSVLVQTSNIHADVDTLGTDMEHGTVVYTKEAHERDITIKARLLSLQTGTIGLVLRYNAGTSDHYRLEFSTPDSAEGLVSTKLYKVVNNVKAEVDEQSRTAQPGGAPGFIVGEYFDVEFSFIGNEYSIKTYAVDYGDDFAKGEPENTRYTLFGIDDSTSTKTALLYHFDSTDTKYDSTGAFNPPITNLSSGGSTVPTVVVAPDSDTQNVLYFDGTCGFNIPATPGATDLGYTQEVISTRMVHGYPDCPKQYTWQGYPVHPIPDPCYPLETRGNPKMHPFTIDFWLYIPSPDAEGSDTPAMECRSDLGRCPDFEPWPYVQNGACASSWNCPQTPGGPCRVDNSVQGWKMFIIGSDSASSYLSWDSRILKSAWAYQLIWTSGGSLYFHIDTARGQFPPFYIHEKYLQNQPPENAYEFWQSGNYYNPAPAFCQGKDNVYFNKWHHHAIVSWPEIENATTYTYQHGMTYQFIDGKRGNKFGEDSPGATPEEPGNQRAAQAGWSQRDSATTGVARFGLNGTLGMNVGHPSSPPFKGPNTGGADSIPFTGYMDELRITRGEATWHPVAHLESFDIETEIEKPWSDVTADELVGAIGDAGSIGLYSANNTGCRFDDVEVDGTAISLKPLDNHWSIKDHDLAVASGYTSSWSISDELIQSSPVSGQGGEAGTIAYAHGISIQDIELRARLLSTKSTGTIGLVARYNETTGSHYRLEFTDTTTKLYKVIVTDSATYKRTEITGGTTIGDAGYTSNLYFDVVFVVIGNDYNITVTHSGGEVYSLSGSDETLDTASSLLYHFDAYPTADQFKNYADSSIDEIVITDSEAVTISSYFRGWNGELLLTPDAGDNNGIRIPYNSIAAGNFTIDFRLNLSDNTINSFIIGANDTYYTNHHSSTPKGFAFVLNSNGTATLHWPVSVGSPWESKIFDVEAQETNVWYHWAIVRDGTDVRIYQNGNIKETIVIPPALEFRSVGNPYGWNIGQAQDNAPEDHGAPLRGAIDEFRVLNGTVGFDADFDPPESPYSDLSAGSIGLYASSNDSCYFYSVRAYQAPPYKTPSYYIGHKGKLAISGVNVDEFRITKGTGNINDITKLLLKFNEEHALDSTTNYNFVTDSSISNFVCSAYPSEDVDGNINNIIYFDPTESVSVDTIENLTPLSFIKKPATIKEGILLDDPEGGVDVYNSRILANLDSSYVEYWFDIYCDHEIEEDILCENLPKSDTRGNIFTQNTLNCPDADRAVQVSEGVTEEDEGEEC